MIGILVSAALAAARCSSGGEFEPAMCPSGLPAVAAIRIEQQGASLWAARSDDEPCAGFRLREADVRRFLRHAGRADPRDVHFTLPESPCIARGSVRFGDGGIGHWQIDRYALGWLDRPGHERMTLYCRRCRSDPWRQ